MSAGQSGNGGAMRPGVPLIDGIDKVTGRARYTADLEHADALVGRIFRSPVSHGEIVRLDVSKARALDGVGKSDRPGHRRVRDPPCSARGR